MSSAGELWLCYGGIELVNSCLTNSLQGNGHGLPGVRCGDCDSCCEDLNRALGYGVNGGSITQAPWYDENEPLSLEFAGIMVTSIEGLTPGEFSRSVTEGAAYGAILGQGRNIAPQITVTGILMGSCCGADYGLQWLRNSLRGPCGTDKLCQGADLEFLACAPSFPDEDCPGNENLDYEALLTPYIRSFRNVAVTSGPTISQRIPRACPGCQDCPMLEVTWTMAAADPCVYREPFTIEEGLAFDCELPANDECVEWITSDMEEDCEECPGTEPCNVDPDCQDVSPPEMPGIASACVLGCIQADQCRACFVIPEGTFPANGEGTFTMEIYAGDMPLRGVQVRGWTDPLGTDPALLPECDACFGLNISYVAPYSTLVIDGASRTATIQCPGGATVRANPFISAQTRSPAFSYPVLDGCSAYTVCVNANGPVSTAASITVVARGRDC